MSFKYINLKNVFSHTNTELSFTDGINIIHGENRKGKSSICEAMCFALTNQITKENISGMIKDGEDSAVIDFDYENLPRIIKTRKALSTSISGIDKKQLDDKVNLSFNEFKNLFYVSSSDDFSLFDSSYLAKFLEEVFQLRQYEKTYDRLRNELSTITKEKEAQSAIEQIIKNTETIKAHRVVLLDKLSKLEDALTNKINPIYNKFEEDKNIISANIGRLEGSLYSKQKELSQLSLDICPTCKRAFQKNTELIDKVKNEILNIEKLISNARIERQALHGKQAEVISKQGSFRSAINKVYSEISSLDTQLNIVSNAKVIDTSRIADISSIIDAFKPSGFPLFLIQKYIPSIQAAATSLIRVVFPDMSIKINTDATRNGKLNLAIKVLMGSNERGLSACCGAETVLINLCLRLAVISIFTKFRKTICDVFIIDEGFEKFDDSTSIKTLELLRYCMSVGFIKQAIIVTHKDVLKQLDNVNYVVL